uniref:hypothetical protein n=1 Tax=Burkholderia anthina TaxID=179879 RepID=UPI00158F4679
MAARVRVQQTVSLSPACLRANLRPLCHAIALMLAAIAPVHAHAAGIMNLGQVAARAPGGGAAGAGGLP